MIDFASLNYISSAGLRSVLVVGKRIEGKGGSLRVCSLKGIVKTVFEVAGFTAIFPVFESVGASGKVSPPINPGAIVNTPDAVKLTLPNEISYLPTAQAVVREAARRRGFEPEALSEFEVAVEEAVTNVMKHAYDSEENPTFDLICEEIPGGLQVILREKGIPFDPKLMPHYKPELAALHSSPAGIGFHLMKSLMDDVQLINLGPAGKETRLIKRLAAAAAAPPPTAAAAPARTRRSFRKSSPTTCA